MPAKKSKKKAEASTVKEEKIIRDIILPPDKLEALKKEIPKMKVITPTVIVQKYNVKVSVAKNLLRDLHKQGLIKFVAGTRRLDIYVPASS
ncbi:MAG: 30S ribosomal protein S25e [Candidatus Odinarchaeia archaeon]